MVARQAEVALVVAVVAPCMALAVLRMQLGRRQAAAVVGRERQATAGVATVVAEVVATSIPRTMEMVAVARPRQQVRWLLGSLHQPAVAPESLRPAVAHQLQRLRPLERPAVDQSVAMLRSSVSSPQRWTVLAAVEPVAATLAVHLSVVLGP